MCTAHYSREGAAQDVGAAADDAAKRIEAAAPMTEKALAAICERLERVEQGVDDLKKRPTAPSDLAPQMARLESLRSSRRGQGRTINVSACSSECRSSLRRFSETLRSWRILTI
jgi:hypothetical protein